MNVKWWVILQFKKNRQYGNITRVSVDCNPTQITNDDQGTWQTAMYSCVGQDRARALDLAKVISGKNTQSSKNKHQTRGSNSKSRWFESVMNENCGYRVNSNFDIVFGINGAEKNLLRVPLK
jgi:hypothetical protein